MVPPLAGVSRVEGENRHGRCAQPLQQLEERERNGDEQPGKDAEDEDAEKRDQREENRRVTGRSSCAGELAA